MKWPAGEGMMPFGVHGKIKMRATSTNRLHAQTTMMTIVNPHNSLTGENRLFS
jgi:hypothetical protein